MFEVCATAFWITYKVSGSYCMMGKNKIRPRSPQMRVWWPARWAVAANESRLMMMMSEGLSLTGPLRWCQQSSFTRRLWTTGSNPITAAGKRLQQRQQWEVTLKRSCGCLWHSQNLIAKSADETELHHNISCKSVFVDCQMQTTQSCKAMWGDRISSFWNHLLKCVLTINRKFLHSLWVYSRSELRRRTKAETPWVGARLQHEQRWES